MTDIDRAISASGLEADLLAFLQKCAAAGIHGWIVLVKAPDTTTFKFSSNCGSIEAGAIVMAQVSLALAEGRTSNRQDISGKVQ